MPYSLRKRNHQLVLLEAGEKESFSCQVCRRPDTAEIMAACDKCSRWLHFSCAGVDETIVSKYFVCDACKQLEDRQRSGGSKQSVRSSTSSVRAARVALQIKLLEEEKALQEKYMQEQRKHHNQQLAQEAARREEEAKRAVEYTRKELLEQMEIEATYLKKKFDLENAQLDEDEARSSRRSVSERQSSITKVSEWLTKQRDVEVTTDLIDLGVEISDKPLDKGLVQALAPVSGAELQKTQLPPKSSASFGPGNKSRDNEIIPSSGGHLQQQRFHSIPRMSNLSLGQLPQSNMNIRFPQLANSNRQSTPKQLAESFGNTTIYKSFDLPTEISTMSLAEEFKLPAQRQVKPDCLYQPHEYPTMPPGENIGRKLLDKTRDEAVRQTSGGFNGPWIEARGDANSRQHAMAYDAGPLQDRLSQAHFLAAADTRQQSRGFNVPQFEANEAAVTRQHGLIYDAAPLPNLRSGLVHTPAIGNSQPYSNFDMPYMQEWKKSGGNRLTAEQIAARQVMPKDLPSFSGDPEDWPIFISCFTMTTEACGYSEVENLIRLQRCLKGVAWDAVRSRLLLPSAVPGVINTLELLFGRPELIINTLLKRIRDVPAPRSEKLETLISFGMAVENFCSHLEAAGQHLHLSNPVLLQELVDKLPNNFKLDWALYRQQLNNVASLKEFAIYMSTLVSAASSVTSHVEFDSQKTLKDRMNIKPKDRKFVNAHDSSSLNEADLNTERSPHLSLEKHCLMCQHTAHGVEACAEFKRLNVEERWKEVYARKICRVCLGPYDKRPCDVKNRCGVDECKKKHHPLLHPMTQGSERVDRPTTLAVTTHHHSLPSALFKIIPITLYGKSGYIEAYAFLDDGSSLTLMERSLAQQLGLDGEESPLCLVWTANVTREEPDSRRVELDVSGIGSRKRFPLKDVRTVNELVLPKQSLNLDVLAENFGHLTGLPIKSYTNVCPRILIGINNGHLTIPQKKREGSFGDPIAIKTRLGWTVFGGTSDAQGNINLHVEACHCQTYDDQLHDIVKEFFAVEGVGVSVELLESKEERRAKEIMKNTTVRIGSRFITGLLWKSNDFEFPDSYPMALRRLGCLERRLKKDQRLKESVAKQIDDYVDKGYAHRATEQELLSADQKKVWYLPLGVVLNDNKPGKLRVICDAAAKVNGVSLNSMLLKGPDQLVALPKVLSRFRQRRVAFSGDIREMFHQIRIQNDDKQAQRFLWRTNPQCPPDVYVLDVATFGATCSPSQAQYIKNLNASEFATEYPRAVDAIVNSHYVDDLLDSCDTDDEAIQLASEVRLIHAAGGFEIRNWISNSQNFLDIIGDRNPTNKISIPLENSGTVTIFERVLGMIWIPQEDTFTFSMKIPTELEPVWLGERVPTKREVLKCVMRLFDPLGMLAHFIIHGKIIIQDVWRSGVDWDEPIPVSLMSRWKEWTKLFCQLEKVRIPRCYFNAPRQPETIELHIFVDASEVAYACVAYLRAIINEKVQCSFVAGKAKVAPLKALSIPRMELQAGVLGARLAESVAENHSLPISRRVIWTDSDVLLSWIQSDERNYREFVKFRISEISTKTKVSEWRYVPSKLNVADDATKWGKGPELSPGSRWFTAPKFLYDSEDSWPTKILPPKDVNEEKRLCLVHREKLIGPMIDFTRFSKWERLHRASGWVVRFIKNYWRRTKGLPLLQEGLTSGELQVAERWIWRLAQNENFSDELIVLKEHQLNPENLSLKLKKVSSIYNLSPKLDEFGILRVDSRIGSIDKLTEDAKYPIILPKRHPVTDLILDSYHRRYKHANRETTVNEVKQRFQVPNLRCSVDRIRRNCQWCKIKNAKPQVPRMAPLPRARLEAYCRPFSYVGVDFFGPITVTVGRKHEKRWVALFTCLVTRAVHLEITYTINTESCKMAIRRFIAHRGAPLEIYSDNGTNFVGASNELIAEIKERNRELAETFTNTTTKWMFNPPAAPHMGGVWERMVRSIKVAYESMSFSRHPNDETLATVLAESQGIVNSRPLTFVSLEAGDEEALTPNHFLMLSSNVVTQPQKKVLPQGTLLRTNWRLAQAMLDHFWKRWLREYMPVIARRSKWFEETEPLRPGNLVIITDEGKRNSWVRGRITEVLPGVDGRVRQAKVTTSSGPLKRPVPVARLALLDVSRKRKTDTDSQCYGVENVET